MMSAPARFCVALVTVVVSVAIACPARAVPATTAVTCFAAWSDAGPVVAREALTPARDLHALAHARNIGDVVRIKLCSEDGHYVYQLLVREPQGRVIRVTVDAQRPVLP